jgi:hypothetical protein
MTLFFGVPSHRYWADQISREEMVILNQLKAAAEDIWQSDPNLVYKAAKRAISGQSRGIPDADSGIWNLEMLVNLSEAAQNIYFRTCREIATNAFLSNVGESIGAVLGRFKPFRRYHLLTSDHHILMNNIKASKKGTFNAVSLKYNDGAIYTLKADDSIPDELTRVESFNYPSCDNETLARRYCIGLLNRHLKDVYKGEIVVTGMDIDPIDICYIHDDRSGMYGPVEVEQVVDTFTAETGWITEITPDLITGTNEWATRSTSEARIAVLGSLAQKYLGYRMGTEALAGSAVAGVVGGSAFGALGGAAVGALSSGGALATGIIGATTVPGVMAVGGIIAWMGGYHIIRWTQDRQPIWVCPLILGERPFFAGLDGFKQDGIFASIRGRLAAEIDKVSEGWRVFHLAGFANDMTVSLARALTGQSGA